MFEFNQFINKLSLNRIESIIQLRPVSPIFAISSQGEHSLQNPNDLKNSSDQQQISPPEKKSEKNQINTNQTLTAAEREPLIKLKARDAEVRRHEQTHAQAAGPYLRQGPQFTYQKGPDNKLYAIGGHVLLDVSKGATPEETLKKATTVKRAALASHSPSSQDHNIVRQADRLIQEARQQIQKEKRASQVFTPQGQIDTLAASSLIISVLV